MKNRLPLIAVTVVITIVCLACAVILLYGMQLKPKTVLSEISPDGMFNAYVSESPSMDPPNQSLFVSRSSGNEFRLIEELPEDIEYVKQIVWSPDGKKVVFATNWNLVITNTESFNVMKISINHDWWSMHRNGTFSSSEKDIRILEIGFNGADTLTCLTDNMSMPLAINLSSL